MSSTCGSVSTNPYRPHSCNGSEPRQFIKICHVQIPPMFVFKDSLKHKSTQHCFAIKGCARKNEVIATFGSADVRLRLLLTQYGRLPFPAATAALLPYTCHCGAVHMKLQATDDVSSDAILFIGEASDWQGCLVQFDGSAHKRTQTGGAGICLLHITQEVTSLVRWKSIPLAPCADNVIAEAKPA